MRTATRHSRLSAALAAAVIAVAGCGPTAPSQAQTPAPSAAVVSPSTSPSAAPSAVPTVSLAPAPSAPPTTPPSASGNPAVATRVVVPDLGIDLAVTKSPPASVYPYCNVAMYLGPPLGQPGQARATYLFAHARVGMFYPIYDLTMLERTPGKMVGMLVDVYTSDAMLHVYRITRVLPHQLTLDAAIAAGHDELWLQTSEGPHGTPGKTQVVAEPVSTAPTDAAAAHPRVHVVRCGA